MKYILPLLLFCVPAQAEVVREMSNLVTKDNVNTRVGINTLTPTATLDVNGTVSMLGPVAVTGSSFSVGVSTLVVAGGNVGIGTTAPASKLHISSGTITLDGTGSPAVGYALCLAASGAMGHCTDTPAANGACTCTTP